MKSYKTIVKIPWADGNYDQSVSNFGAARNNIIVQEGDAYARVPLIFRAIRLRCNSLLRVPRYIYNEKNEILNEYKFENTMPLHDLLWLSEAAILLKGASYVLKNNNVYGYNTGLQWIIPFTMNKVYQNDEYLYYQLLPDGKRYPANGKYWTVDDFLYFKDFNPFDDLAEGISATEVALDDARLAGGVSKFLADFFRNDALPVTMVIMPEDTQDTERERVENWFKKRLRGLRNQIQRVIGVSGDIKIEKLTSELKSFDFDKVDIHTVSSISDAFELPQSLLRSTSGANRSISDNERRSFLQDTIIPRTNFYERILNPFLKEFGQRIEFAPQELGEMQENEKLRSTALKDMTDSGIPLLAALDMLGYELSDNAQAIIDKDISDKQKRSEQIPKQVSDQPDESGYLQDPHINDMPNTQETKQIKSELDKWMRKALSNYRTKKTMDFEFVSDAIPKEQIELISLALKTIKNEDELKKVFAGDNHANR
jgi:HK97 family phage portal protein